MRAFVLAAVLTAGATIAAHAAPVQEFGQTDVSTCVRQQMNFRPDFVDFGAGETLYAYPVAQIDTRHRIRTLARSVGRLAIKLHGPNGDEAIWCTATLIADDMIITAQHCLPADGKVYDARTGITYQVTAATLEMNYLTLGSTDVRRFRVNPVPVAGNFSTTLDYSIARVEGNPGRAFGHVRLVRRAINPTDDLLIIHHARGCPEMFSRSCKLSTTGGSGVITHRCPTDSGSSGALIFSELDYAVLGIHSGAAPRNAAGPVNVGHGIDAIMATSPILRGLAPGGAQPNLVAVNRTDVRAAAASVPATRREMTALTPSVQARSLTPGTTETRLAQPIQPRADADPGWRDVHDSPKTCADYARLRWGTKWRIVASDIQCYDPAAERANRDFSESYYAYRSFVRARADAAEEKSLRDEALVLINFTTDACKISDARSPEDLYYPSRVARIAGCIVTISGQRLARLQQRALRYLRAQRLCTLQSIPADARIMLQKVRYSAAEISRIEQDVCRA